MGLASWIREKVSPYSYDAIKAMHTTPIATHDDTADAMWNAKISQSLDYDDPQQGGMPPYPEWYNSPDTAWKAAMAEATRAQQLKAATAYSDYAARGTVNWNIGSNSTQPIPQMGDVITTDGIMAIVRHEMERGAGKAVVKCQHCGMWAARFCACGKCGAPVD